MQSDFHDLSDIEKRLAENLGVASEFIGLNKLKFDQSSGWYQASVYRSHQSKYELGPIPIAEAMRHLAVIGKLSVILDPNYASGVSCIVRSCKVIRAIELNLSTEDQQFVVKSKLNHETSELAIVSTRLEGLDGKLFLFAHFEYQLAKANEVLAGVDLKTLEQGIISGSAARNPAYTFDHECVQNIHLTNRKATGVTRIKYGELSPNYFSCRRYYPASFISAGLITLASRLAAGRHGKRRYSYSVKYVECSNQKLTFMDQSLDLVCDYVERAGSVEVIRGGALQDGVEVYSIEVGVVLF